MAELFNHIITAIYLMVNILTTPKNLKQRALKIWKSGILHRAWLQNSNQFPLEIPLKNIPAKTLLADFSEVQEIISTLRQDGQKYGHTIINNKTISHRQLGEQSIPTVIAFKTETLFLNYVAKTAEFTQFKHLTEQSLKQDTILLDWLIRFPFKVIKYANIWSQLLNICHYFKAHPQPDCYIRQLDIRGIDSKFIEQHKSILNELLTQILDKTQYDHKITGLSHHGFERRYGFRYDQPLIRFRILDPSLAINGLTDLTLSLSEFKQLDIAVNTIFIAENKINGLAFPHYPLAFPHYPKAIVIFGLGYAVNLLTEIKCLQGRSLYYWGDIDTDGLAILSRLRQYYPETKSLLMDQQTLDQFTDLVVIDPIKSPEKSLNYLTEKEKNLYYKLQQESLRLEQERISFSYFKQCLLNIQNNML